MPVSAPLPPYRCLLGYLIKVETLMSTMNNNRIDAKLAELASQARGILVVEMNAGQMVEDVRLAVGDSCPIHFHGRMGGVVPLPDEILEALKKVDADIARGREA